MVHRSIGTSPVPPDLGEVPVHGNTAPRFAPVRSTFERCFRELRDVGASVCVIHRDEVVVDLWGGHTDRARHTPWDRDSITNVWSLSKLVTNLALLVLVDRETLSLDRPVADVWPEFSANGKGEVLVRHVLGHSAGLPGWAEPMTHEDLADWEKATSILARQAPFWEPGSTIGYHPYTQGFLVGELIRRTTGVSPGRFIQDELADPLGADFALGVAPADVHRVVPNLPPRRISFDHLRPESYAARTLTNPPMVAEPANEPWWRRAEIPGANGHTNARAVATIQSIVSSGGYAGGRRFLRPETLDRIFEVQGRGRDKVLGIPLCWGIGWALHGPETPMGAGGRTCFWGGWGGSLAACDRDRDLTISYVMNRMGLGTIGDARCEALVSAVHACIDVSGASSV